MTYPNAFAGVKKIFSARILYLIATILLVGGAVYFMISAKMITPQGLDTTVLEQLMDDPANAAKTVGPASVPILVGVVLFIVAFIMELVGLGKAGKDEGAFRTGLWIAIIGVVAILALGFIKPEKTVGAPTTVLEVVSNVISLLISVLVAFCIVKGIQNLAVKLDRADMLPQGKTINVFLWIQLVLCIVPVILPLFFESPVLSYVSMVGGLAGIIAFFMLLSYLGKAKNMLASK